MVVYKAQKQGCTYSQVSQKEAPIPISGPCGFKALVGESVQADLFHCITHVKCGYDPPSTLISSHEIRIVTELPLKGALETGRGARLMPLGRFMHIQLEGGLGRPGHAE